MSLLSLPREIRDIIIELAISHTCDAPSDPNAARQSGHYEERKDMIGWLSTKSLNTYGTAEPILYPVVGCPIAPHASPTALRGTCHQLRSETLAAMKRIPRIFEVDAMLVDEEYLIVTWTRVPPWISKYDSESLHLTIRLFGVWNPNSQIGPGNKGERSEAILGDLVATDDPDETEETAAMLRRSNGFSLSRSTYSGTLPGKALCALSLLFERFFRGGAYGKRFPYPSFDAQVSVRDLSIMILEPTDAGAEKILSSSILPHQAPEHRYLNTDQHDWRLNPVTVKFMMVEWFKAIPRITYMPNEPGNLSKMMYRVDNVVFASENGSTIRFSRAMSPAGLEWLKLADKAPDDANDEIVTY